MKFAAPLLALVAILPVFTLGSDSAKASDPDAQPPVFSYQPGPAVGAAPTNAWAQVSGPTRGSRGPIGAYAAGCIDGAVPLALDGPGYQIMRPSRHRYFGHESLLGFIRGLALSVSSARIGTILVGDMGQARGGPMPSGHASHQVGLDVDVWFWLDPVASVRPLTPEERETLSADPVVDLGKWSLIPGHWRKEHAEILKLASSRPEVERIFVSPVIKRELCQTAGADRAWLHKIRPYYYHHDHFHVRLRCPEGAAHCSHQEAVPPGDGCGSDLDWWFDPRHHNPPPSPPGPPNPKLPALCQQILKS